MNAPMITVADYSNGSEGYTYNYYVRLSAFFFLYIFFSRGGVMLYDVLLKHSLTCHIDANYRKM